MEMLSDFSVDTFKNLVWLVAFIVGGLFLIGSRVSSSLKIAARVINALLALRR